MPRQYAGCEQGGELERKSLSDFLSYAQPKDLNANTPEALGRIIYGCLTVESYGSVELEKDLVDIFLRD